MYIQNRTIFIGVKSIYKARGRSSNLSDYENFEKGMIYMKILIGGGGSREKKGDGIHFPSACVLELRTHNNFPIIVFFYFDMSLFAFHGVLFKGYSPFIQFPTFLSKYEYSIIVFKPKITIFYQLSIFLLET